MKSKLKYILIFSLLISLSPKPTYALDLRSIFKGVFNGNSVSQAQSINFCFKSNGAVYVIGEGFKNADCKNNDKLFTLDLIGAKGPTGDKGPIGDQGPTGPTGQQGPIGEQGIPGVQGIIGDKGPTGDKGPIGDQGPIGPTGPQGEQGLPGPTGVSVTPEKIQVFEFAWHDTGEQSAVIDAQGYRMIILEGQSHNGMTGLHLYYSDDQTNWTDQDNLTIDSNNSNPLQKTVIIKARYYKVGVTNRFSGLSSLTLF